MSCRDSGSSTCSQTVGAIDCCSNSAADPRVVMPTPDGLQCADPLSSEQLQEEACRQFCSAVSDCYEECVDLQNRGLVMDFDLLDSICQYAISEACFEGSFDPIVVGGAAAR